MVMTYALKNDFDVNITKMYDHIRNPVYFIKDTLDLDLLHQ